MLAPYSSGRVLTPGHAPLSPLLQFPDSLRQHLLGILHRAALLVQLREICQRWKEQGLAKPSGKRPLPLLWDVLSLLKA